MAITSIFFTAYAISMLHFLFWRNSHFSNFLISHFLYSGNTFLTIFFMSFDPSFLHFDFNLIAASNNSLERSSINNFLVDYLAIFSWFNNVILCFTNFNNNITIIIICIRINSDKFTSKFFFFFSLSLSFILFYFFYLCQCVLFDQLLLLIYAL